MSAQALITFGTDRRLVLANGEAIRATSYTSNWTQIRVGILGGLVNTSADIVGNPVLAFGVCAGNTNGYGAASSTHVVGVRTQAASFAYHAGPPAYIDNIGAATSQRFKKIGATVTATNMPFTNNGMISATTSIRSALFVEIQRGSPNFTIGLAGATSAAGAQADLTQTEFYSMMELPFGGTYSSVKSGYGFIGGSSSFAVDEATNGVCDHIFVFWDRAAQQFGWDIAHKKLS
jgi:hypothetical protein